MFYNRFFVITCFVVTTFLFVISCSEDKNDLVSSVGENGIESSTIIKQLRTAGWTEKAAQAVISVNQDYFAMLTPERRTAIISALERLGAFDYLSIIARLENYPELAALYATSPTPLELDRAFISDDCAGVYTGMFQLMIDRYEQQDLTSAFQRHGRTICRLGQRGIPTPATLFMFDHTQPGAEEYARWLDDALRAQNDEERLAELIAMALNHGVELRQRLATDTEFRRHFRTNLWPAFIRVTDCATKADGECDTPFELLADEPRVWDLLMQDDGETLLSRSGLLAVELLTDAADEQAFPIELRPLVKESLLNGDNSSINALLRFQNNPLFRRVLLRDDLNEELRQRILVEINKVCPETAAQCPSLENRLRDLGSFSLATLNEDLAPSPDGLQTWIPLYDTYYVMKKFAQGRDVSDQDMALAALDLTSLFVIGKVGGTVVKQTLKKKVATTVAQKTAKRTLRTANNNWVEQLAGKGQLMTAVTKEYLKPMLSIPRHIGDKIDKLITIDVTQLTQWMFIKSGIGRVSMKKLSGLEARILMRQDARVTIHIKDELIDQLREELAQKAIEEYPAWQAHASAWWFETAHITP